FHAARRHAGAFEIATRDPVLGIDDPRARRYRHERKRFGGLAAIRELDRPAQRCRRGGETSQPIQDCHLSEPPGLYGSRIASLLIGSITPRMYLSTGRRPTFTLA